MIESNSEIRDSLCNKIIKRINPEPPVRSRKCVEIILDDENYIEEIMFSRMERIEVSNDLWEGIDTSRVFRIKFSVLYVDIDPNVFDDFPKLSHMKFINARINRLHSDWLPKSLKYLFLDRSIFYCIDKELYNWNVIISINQFQNLPSREKEADIRWQYMLEGLKSFSEIIDKLKEIPNLYEKLVC